MSSSSTLTENERTLSIEATKEIQLKLNRVSELIASDAETIAKQSKIIKEQQEIINKQANAIKHVRDELIEIKKQLLINEAKSTPKDFRNNLTKYLLDLREELIILAQNEKNNKEIKNDDDEKSESKLDEHTSAALYNAAGRAIETNRGGKDRLFSDEYSLKFTEMNNNYGYNFISSFANKLTELNLKNNIKSEITINYLSMFVAFKTKWIDNSIYFALKTDKERMRQNLTKGTIKQIVVLGSQFDSRSFRLIKLPKDLKIYNIDTKNIITIRKKIFGDDYGVCKYVDIEYDDLFKENGNDNNKLIDLLTKNGFNKDKKTIFICEGILEYLVENDLFKLLNDVSSICCDGSWIIGEIPNKINISLKEMHDIWVNLGAQKVKTGIDLPKDEILDKYGFKQFQDVNILGTNDSNFNNRCPESYIKYQLTSEARQDDKITRIQLFRGMKSDDSDDQKTPL